jgi:hypothetical protein
MSFVNHYLPYFRQQLITQLLSSLLPFQPCLLKVCMEISSLPFPLLLCAFSFLPPLLCASFQFVVYPFFVCLYVFVGGQSADGAMLVYSGGGWGNTS